MSGQGPENDERSRVTSIGTVVDPDRTAEDGIPAMPEVAELPDTADADIEIALPRVPSSPDLGVQGESPIRRGVRDRVASALPSDVTALTDDDHDVELIADPLPEDFANAILARFNDDAERDMESVWLVLSGFDVQICSDRVEVCSPTELGDSHDQDVYNQPEIETVIDGLCRTESLVRALLPLGFVVMRRGYNNGYYEVIVKKDTRFESGSQLVAYLEGLRPVLEEVNVQNSTESIVPPSREE